MELSFKTIIGELSDFDILSTSFSETGCASRIRPFTGTPEKGTVFVAPASEMKAFDTKETADTLFIIVGSPSDLPPNYAILSPDTDEPLIFDRLLSVFRRFSDYSAELAAAALSPGYDPVIEIASKFIDNPIFFMDASHRMKGIYPKGGIPGDPEWAHMSKNGFISLDAVKAMNTSGELDEISHADVPVLKRSAIFKFMSLTVNVFLQKSFVGRIVAISAFKDLNGASVDALQILAEILKRKIINDTTYGRNQKDDPMYSLLMDLATRRKVDENFIKDRVNSIPGWSSGYFFILLVPYKSEDEIFINYYMEAVRRFDSKSIYYKSAFVTVLHIQDINKKDELFTQVTEFLLENNLYGGISDSFGSLSHLSDYYEQGLAALKFRTGRDTLTHFYSVALENLVSFLPDQKAHYLMHPALETLKEFDQQNSAQLYDTLKVYLFNERSINLSSAELFIHRNSLPYRLSKIEELTGVDLSDKKTRLYLMLSYYWQEQL